VINSEEFPDTPLVNVNLLWYKALTVITEIYMSSLRYLSYFNGRLSNVKTLLCW